MSSPSLSFLVLTYERPRELIFNIQSFLSICFEGVDWELIILNNSPHFDYSSFHQFLDSCDSHHASRVNFIDASGNVGVCVGRNLLSHYASGDVLVFLDDDLIIEDSLFAIKISNFFSKSYSFLLAMQVFNGPAKRIMPHEFPFHRFEYSHYSLPFQSYTFLGGAFAVSRSIYSEIGGFPEFIFYGMEEFYFSFAFLEHGGKIVYEPSVGVVHLASPNGRPVTSTSYVTRVLNKLSILYVFIPRIIFPISLILWSAAVLLKCRSVFSLFSLLRGLPSVFSRRRRPLSFRTLVTLVKLGSPIVF